MSPDKLAAEGSFLSELAHVGLYKPTQGRIARQITGGALAVVFAIAAWRMSEFAKGGKWFSNCEYILPVVVLVVGLWFSYRIVNLPKFADFLIAVEAEMNKVSWPSRAELYRSSFVVIFVIAALTLALFGFDFLWQLFFEAIGVIKTKGGES